MEIILIKAAQLVLCLALLIILHEGGHFLFAKLFKIRVEKFFLFFDWKFKFFSTYSPWFRRLMGKKPIEKDAEGNYPYHGTEYGIGWLPLGGYVKISGMIDESMDKEQMAQPPQPWEFRTKPAWQRLLVMLGGVMMNFIVAFVLYGAILFVWGETYVPIKDIKQGFTFNEQAHKLGFQEGDIPLSADGKEFKQFNIDMLRAISNAKQVAVLRQGKTTTLQMPAEGVSLLDMMQADKAFLSVSVPTVVDSVIAGTSAAKAHIAKGDTIKSFNSVSVSNWSDYMAQVSKLSKSLEGATTNDSIRKRTVTLTVAHANTGALDTVKVLLDPELHMGITQTSMYHIYKPVTKQYSIAEAIPGGFALGASTINGYINDLKYIPTKEGVKSLHGPLLIGKMFPDTWNWEAFWRLTAFISIILAVMNLLPIPALDGGHALFCLLEMITRRKFSVKVQTYAQYAGMILLLILMVYALGNDIFTFLF